MTLRSCIPLALALAAAGCATPRPPRADRIVYVTEYVDVEEPAVSANPAPPRAPVRDDVPESVRREWYAKNGPAPYVPPRDEPDVVVRERRVYVDRDWGGCGGCGGYGYSPVRLSLGYFGFHGSGRRGWGYGVGVGNGFGCW